MGMLDAILGRRKAISTWVQVEDFVDGQAAFLVNRSMYEYSRARAGILAEKLFREQSFKEAIEEGRWRAFPLSIANVAELADGLLRPAAAGRE
ncbi:MAG: Esterase, partial [Xanthobacteraceae bacterium]